MVPVTIMPNDSGTPPGTIPDAEWHVSDGPLAGVQVIGCSWWPRRGGAGRHVACPARQSRVNGERRSVARLRPLDDTAAHEAVRQRSLDAYAAYEPETWSVVTNRLTDEDLARRPPRGVLPEAIDPRTRGEEG